MLLKYAILLTIFANSFSKGEDVFYNINSKEILHKVSDKFLSISIDPAVLLAGVNLSDASLLLAKHLSPAYIRLAGPSTPFVRYVDNEEEIFARKDKGVNVHVTPSMWFGINEWFNLANLTPVFGLNDGDTHKGVWDPKSTMALLEMSDKFGVACYWQLGYGCSNKTTIQYVEDLNILKQTLNGFPEHNSTWKIVGSDLSACKSDGLADNEFEAYMRDLDENVDAVMWETTLIPKGDLGLTKAALWASIPKDREPVTFSSAIEWATKVGQAATMEYDVIFREPRLLEFTKDTPVYWFSFLHKRLMGSNVLEVGPTSENSDLSTFAHCTRRQNDFVRSGAITILMVNNGSKTGMANVRLGNILLDKSMEVQSYVLKASNDSASKVMLNDQLLTMEMLRRPEDILRPILRRAKVRTTTHISLEVPGQAIAFFVLTGAKYSLCIDNEDDLSAILQEINEDQELSLTSSEETLFNIEGRLRQEKVGDAMGHKTTLEDIKRNILREMEQDKSYYDKTTTKTRNNKNDLDNDDKGVVDNYNKEMLHKHLRKFIDKSKKNDLKTGINSKKENLMSNFNKPQPNSLHLTIQEIEEILKKRAKARAAAKNIKLTSSELDMLVDKATLRIPKHFIAKRDINRVLLEEKANFYENNIFNQDALEQYAKEHKMFPKFKLKRSHKVGRPNRSINTPHLLNLKALMEESKKYLLNMNKRLRNSGNSLFKKRVARDINLDLLKKRSEPNSQFGKNKVTVVQPRKHQKFGLLNKGKHKLYDPINLDGEDSEELFDELTRFEQSLLDDFTSPKKPLADLDSLDLENYEKQFSKKKPTTSKGMKSFGNGFFIPQRTKPSKPKSTKSRLDSDEYLQFLKSSDEEFYMANEEEEAPCEGDFEFLDSKSSKKKTIMDLWGLKSSPRKDNSNKGHSSICADFGDYNFSDDADYDGFLRKKRDTNAVVTKEKLKSLKKDIRTEVKKLAHQLKEDKSKYLKDKIKNKTELIKQKRLHGLVLGRRHRTNNIQIIPKNDKNNSTIDQIIANANSDENTVLPPLAGHQIRKRSLLDNNDISRIFGQYKPLSSGLRAWKPADVLNLHKNRFLNWPSYSWVQDQNLRNAQNALIKSMKPFGLRKRRYIENNNYSKNGILDKEFLYKNTVQRKRGDNYVHNNNVEITTNKKVIGQTETASVNDKMTEAKKLSYLERVLGKKKVKPMEDLFYSVKDNLSDINDKVANFFKNLF